MVVKNTLEYMEVVSRESLKRNSGKPKVRRLVKNV